MKKIFTLVLAALTVGTAVAESALVLTFDATPVEGYEAFTGVPCIFEEYDDQVVIKAFDGTEGNDLVVTWDENGWSAINGEASPWIYFYPQDAPYYGAYLYATGGYTGGTWDENGGSFYIGGYFYDLNNASTWNYMYWNLTPRTEVGIADVKAGEKATATVRMTEHGIVIEKAGRQFNAAGQLVK